MEQKEFERKEKERDDGMGGEIQVPLSYLQIASMLKRHVWLEKYVDWDYLRLFATHELTIGLGHTICSDCYEHLKKVIYEKDKIKEVV